MAIVPDMEFDDSGVIRQIKSGKIQAYSLLVNRYQAPIFNLMLRMTRSEALAVELAQETFVRAFDRLDTFDTRRRFFPWLYTLGLNLVRDHLRSFALEQSRTRSFENLDGDTMEYPDPVSRLDEAIDREHLNAALAQVPALTREALLLRFREGFSLQEIADALEIGLSSAKMKIHRGLETLRVILAEEGIDG